MLYILLQKLRKKLDIVKPIVFNSSFLIKGRKKEIIPRLLEFSNMFHFILKKSFIIETPQKITKWRSNSVTDENCNKDVSDVSNDSSLEDILLVTNITELKEEKESKSGGYVNIIKVN